MTTSPSIRADYGRLPSSGFHNTERLLKAGLCAQDRGAGLRDSKDVFMAQPANLATPLFLVDVERSSSLLELALNPYKSHCRYLLGATAKRSENGVSLVEAEGEFSIPESCYIASTGHFNAVEFNICYNQLAYYLLAEIIQNGWIPALVNWKMSDFRQRQLPDCLIVQLHSCFRKPLNARLFTGRIAVNKVSVKHGTIFMKTSCTFEDSSGASCKGEALTAIVDNCQVHLPAESVLTRLKFASSRDRQDVICIFLRDRIAESLSIEPHEVGSRDNLMDLGIDSLKAVELKNAVGAELGLLLSTSLLFDYSNLEALSGYLLQQLGMGEKQVEDRGQEQKSMDCCMDSGIEALPQERVAELLANELRNLNV
jgi:acyl carrier protein